MVIERIKSLSKPKKVILFIGEIFLYWLWHRGIGLDLVLEVLAQRYWHRGIKRPWQRPWQRPWLRPWQRPWLRPWLRPWPYDIYTTHF